MQDRYNREINYARISITDRCNLRCVYCMPQGYVPQNKRILERNEINAIVKALATLGVRRIRLTGGEPLLRNDIVGIVKDIIGVPEISDIGITTNGILLNEYLDQLFEAGLKRVNISLDSLKEDVFYKITGGNVQRVLEAIKKCLDLGIRVKINMVPISGINDDEIPDFINLTKNMDIDVRFIELMPIGPGTNYRGIENSSIIKLLGNPQISKVENLGGGPSQVFSIPGYLGRIGLISPMSHNFCSECNRIRVTSDGKLKTCLHNPGEIDLIPVITDEEQLRMRLYEGIINKYQRHTMDVDKVSRANRKMVGIGG